ncbi:MAG: putative branched-chain amino acid transporter, periplasmic binding protein [Nocardioides sp.]|jgi:branched-chain amino acid transport system substrate-binding protein|nr:putative branched-chain amino acid transporter, periplasmic binding protein [Nocardioides sp.]
MKTPNRPWVAALALAPLLMIAACGSDSGGSKSEGTNLDELDEFVIGASVAKTGGQTFYGGPAMISVQEAIDAINADGGVDGKQIRLIWEDSQTDFAQSAAAAEKVIDQGAQALLVDCDFDYGLPAAQVAQERGVVAMNLCAGSPRAGDPKILPGGFSMGIATNVESAAIAEYAYNTLGYEKVYQLRDNSIEYSKSVCGYFAEAFEALGGEIVGEDGFNNSDSSLQSQVSSLRDAEGDYDAINLCTYNPGLTTAVRQIRSGGIDAPLLGSFTWDGDSWLGDAGTLSDVYFPAYASLYGDDPRPAVNDLVQTVKEKMGSVPFTSFTIPGYSAIEALVKGVEIAGTTNADEVVAAMETFDNEKFLVGPVTFNKDQHIRMVGDNDVAIIKVDQGKPSFVDLVSPAEVPAP